MFIYLFVYMYMGSLRICVLLRIMSNRQLVTLFGILESLSMNWNKCVKWYTSKHISVTETILTTISVRKVAHVGKVFITSLSFLLQLAEDAAGSHCFPLTSHRTWKWGWTRIPPLRTWGKSCCHQEDRYVLHMLQFRRPVLTWIYHVDIKGIMSSRKHGFIMLP